MLLLSPFCRERITWGGAGHCLGQAASHAESKANLRPEWTRLPGLLRAHTDGEAIFRALYGQDDGHNTFWLDR